jgi:hypothetical protein
MSEEVKLSPEEATRVQQIIDDAFAEMEAVSRGITADGGRVYEALLGGGTAQAAENYEGLGRFGQVLAENLRGLASDLNVTINTGIDTDAQAEAQVRQVASNSSVPDPSISAAI